MSETVFSQYQAGHISEVSVWFDAGHISDFESDGGSCVKYKDLQIAVFHFRQTDSWYACQNMCPHKMQMVLSRGLTGSDGNIPKVACPLHKKTYSLIDGQNLGGEDYSIVIFPVKIEAEKVLIGIKGGKCNL